MWGARCCRSWCSSSPQGHPSSSPHGPCGWHSVTVPLPTRQLNSPTKYTSSFNKIPLFPLCIHTHTHTPLNPTLLHAAANTEHRGPRADGLRAWGAPTSPYLSPNPAPTPQPARSRDRATSPAAPEHPWVRSTLLPAVPPLSLVPPAPVARPAPAMELARAAVTGRQTSTNPTVPRSAPCPGGAAPLPGGTPVPRPPP